MNAHFVHRRWLVPALFVFVGAVACGRFGGEESALMAPAGEAFGSLEELAEWEMNYHRGPEPARAYEALAFYCDSGAHEDERSRMPFVAFLAEVYRDSDAALRGAFEAAEDEPSECVRVMLLNTAWFMRNVTGREMLLAAEREWSGETEQDVADSLILVQPGDPLVEPVNSDTHLQMLWGNFFGSGDRAPVERIIDATLREETPEGEVTRLEMAAMVGLQSIAAQDDGVYAILRERAASERGRRRERLDQVIAMVDRMRREGAAAR